jgi:hypothetical protein
MNTEQINPVENGFVALSDSYGGDSQIPNDVFYTFINEPGNRQRLDSIAKAFLHNLQLAKDSKPEDREPILKAGTDKITELVSKYRLLREGRRRSKAMRQLGSSSTDKYKLP